MIKIIVMCLVFVFIMTRAMEAFLNQKIKQPKQPKSILKAPAKLPVLEKPPDLKKVYRKKHKTKNLNLIKLSELLNNPFF